MERKKTSKLHLIAIAAIALAVFGYVTALSSAVSVASGAAISSLAAPGAMEGLEEAHQRVHEEMQAKLLDVTRSRERRAYGLTALQVLVATLLLVGGVLVDKKTPFGRALLMVAFAVAIVFELVQIVWALDVQFELLGIMRTYGPRIAEHMKGPDAIRDSFSAIMEGSVFIGIIAGVAFAGAKIGFCGYGLRFLKKNAHQFRSLN